VELENFNIIIFYIFFLQNEHLYGRADLNETVYDVQRKPSDAKAHMAFPQVS
jgi:hypothetical protein